MPEQNNKEELYWLIGFFAVVVLIGLIVWFSKFLNGFSRELRQLKNEIQRTKGEERTYWMERKRRLWLSLIPFVKY